MKLPKFLLITVGLVLLLFTTYLILQAISHRELKTYVSQGTAKSIDFPQITFKYPSSWDVSEDATGGEKVLPHDNITAAKNGYELTISQELVAGLSACEFKDSPKSNLAAADFTKVDFKEITTNIGTMRYFTIPEESPETKNFYLFCQKADPQYIFPDVGSITITTPKAVDQKIFNEALEIVKSITKISNK